MKTEQAIVIGAGVLLVTFALLWETLNGFPKKTKGAEITTETIKIGLDRPPIWIFYNDSEVNSRNWSDFGARSSHVINLPILNTFYKTIASKNGDLYRIEPIGGLQGVATLLGGWEQLPETMRNPKTRISTAEEDWIRTAILAKYGGLWLSPSVICVKGFGVLPKDCVVAFGQDEDPLYGSPIPGFRALWSPQPGNPMFVEWEALCRDRLENMLGGLQIRKDANSDWLALSAKYTTEIRIKEELGRNCKTNKKLQLEDLFAAGTGGRLPFEIPECAVYIVVPYRDLLERRFYGWILRSSEEQIMESDLVLSHILANL